MSLPLSQNATGERHFTTHPPHLSGRPCASRPVASVGASLVGLPACAEHCAGRRPHCEEEFEKAGRTFLSTRLNSWHGNGDGKKARPTCSCTVVPWKATGRRRLRAKAFTACLALRTIEQTGDSSTALRMTCFAISIGETCPSGLGTNCHPEEALSAVPGTGRRQADEGSPAEVIHTCAAWTCTDGKCSTSGTAPLPASGRGRGEVVILTRHIERDASSGGGSGSGGSGDTGN